MLLGSTHWFWNGFSTWLVVAVMTPMGNVKPAASTHAMSKAHHGSCTSSLKNIHTARDNATDPTIRLCHHHDGMSGYSRISLVWTSGFVFNAALLCCHISLCEERSHVTQICFLVFSTSTKNQANIRSVHWLQMKIMDKISEVEPTMCLYTFEFCVLTFVFSLMWHCEIF